MLPLLILFSCFSSLAWSIPVSPASGRVLMNFQADSHSRFESGIPGESVQGYYSWSDGEKVYRVDYTADKDGYKPVLTTRLIGAAETQHEQQQKPVAHPPASFPIQAVSQKPESVQFEPAAVPPVSNLPVVQAVPASTVSLAPAPVNKPPVHITDDAVIIEADYQHQAAPNNVQNQFNQPKLAYDLFLLNYINQLLQYQDRLIQARQYLEAYQEELMAQRLSALPSDEQNEDYQYQQLAKQFSFKTQEDYEYEQLAQQLSFPPKNDDGQAQFRYNLQSSDYSHQLYENQQQLLHVQHQLSELYNYIGMYD